MTTPRRRAIEWAKRATGTAGLVVKRQSDPSGVHELFALMAPSDLGVPLIRLGPPADGGYLVPDDLEDLALAISPGVSDEVGFDLQLAQRGLRICLVDASVDAPPIEHHQFEFHKKYLDSYDSPPLVSLGALVTSAPAGADLLLQMDIEGGEYRVIHSMPTSDLARFRVLVIEMHHLDECQLPNRARDVTAAMRKLLIHHTVVHAHVNNGAPPFWLGGHRYPSIVELTLLRTDRARRRPVPASVPHALDADCIPTAPPAALPPEWRVSSRRHTSSGRARD